jgi:protein arginine kinase activator
VALFGHKLCDLCSKNRATIKYTRVEDSQVTELLICQSCAAEQSPLHRKSEEATGLQSLFAHLLKDKAAEEAGAKIGGETTHCRQCGLAFETYRKTFLLGCPGCYDSFAEALAVDLRKIHGDVHHLGKIPKTQAHAVEQQRTAHTLRQRLAEAIAREDFEAAAQLRDQIRHVGHTDSES